jgi:hypothetical protein
VEPVASYREIGGRLGAFIRTTAPTTQQIQGLLSDLLTDDKLLLPMRDLVTRQCFVQLQPLAGTGGGVAQRDACLQELGTIYLPDVIGHIGQVITGMLDLAAQTMGNSQNTESFLKSQLGDSVKIRPEESLKQIKSTQSLPEQVEWGWGDFSNAPLPGWRDSTNG